MNTRMVIALFLALPVALLAADAPPRPSLDGTWRWDFVMPDSGVAKPTLRVKTEDDGKLTGLARFRSGSSTPVTNLKLTGDQVSFEVVRERDGEKTVTHYRGTLQGDRITGKVVSKWTGEEQSYDWLATRFSDIEGVWKWRLARGTNAPGGGRRGGGGGGRGGVVEVTLTLKREEGDKIAGKVSLGGGDQEIKQGVCKDNHVTFQTERQRSNGDQSTNWFWGTLERDIIIGKHTTDSGGQRRTNDWRAARRD